MIYDKISQSICPPIRQWEEAGAALGAALTSFLELSLSLETNAMAEGTPPKDLATRIDSTLRLVQTLVDQQISRTRSALVQARNRVLGPIYRLPYELLSEIFMDAVFAAPDLPKPEAMETTVTRVYLALRNLLGVCRRWRNTILDRGEFWSIIPILDMPLGGRMWNNINYALPYSVERSKGDLHLAATRLYGPLYDSLLTPLTPRFRTINIATNDPSTVRQIMRVFLSPDLTEPPALSQVSIYQDQRESYYLTLPREGSYIFSPDSLEEKSFENLVLKLSVLRVRGAQLFWNGLGFSQRLTELHLQELLFGLDSAAVHFLSALSSASELRILKLISIRTYYDGPFIYDTPPVTRIQLPNLQTLFVDDLHFNTLDCFLSSIASHSHRLTLLLSTRCREVDLLGYSTRTISWDVLYELLRKLIVNDLLLAGDVDTPWLSSSELGELTKCISPAGLETLRLNSWHLDATCCSALTYQSMIHGSSSCLINLHLTCARIQDYEALIDMVNSHSDSLRRVVLGAIVSNATKTSWVPIYANHPLALALQHSVPNFQMVDSYFVPSEFEDPLWQL
ncbi:unnamed protein product [Rhizoctonia solani]|uniref:F-box domain-containing protein n=1 Tax=Rhizoctonia solani TaxID=456999 RepID=A0A8H3D4D4_9AGAM|nr:unnamed protein product [Rhizoctonia solani]